MSKRIFTHFKGGQYTLITTAYLEQDGVTVMVIYRDSRGVDYVRPAYEFFGKVACNGKMVKRYTEITHKFDMNPELRAL